MVLFLFVVMMLDIDIATMRAGFVKNLPLAILIAVAMVIEIFWLSVPGQFWPGSVFAAAAAAC